MLHNKPSSNRLQQGFTFIEILIIAPIVILTIGAFITVIVGMTGEVLSSRASSVLAYDVQDALNRIENDVKLSSTFLATNNITLTSGQGYNDLTGGFANASVANGEMLILSVPVTTGNPMSITNSVVYLANKPRPCGDAQITGNTPLTMNVIYFVKNNTLWRRTIMPSTYNDVPNTVCNAPWQQPSCAPNIAGTLCKTQDVKLVDGIGTNGFNVDYFNLANDTAANTIASDTSQLDAARGAAMQATATVGVTINSASTVAGRDISQSATLRATRLDVNASTIVAVVPDVIPAAPTVTASFLAPDNGKASWPAVPGASSYNLQYNINGGAWTTAIANTLNPTYTNDSTSYTVNTFRTNIINFRVSATNTAGTSGYGTGSVTIPPWNALLLVNDWSDYQNAYATSGFTKTSAGVVMLKGLIRKTATQGASETIAVLPPGYRPSEQLIFQTETNPNVASRVDITTGGNIILSVGSNGWVSLDGIKFLPSGSGYTFTPLTPLYNSWTIYSSPPYATPAYTLDSSGRVHLNGLVKNGSSTIGILPVAYRPSLDMYLPGDAANAFGTFTVQAGGNIIPIVYTNPYVSIQAMFYPASYPNGGACVTSATSWCNLTLQNGWVYYGGLTTPQYAKAPDGIVTVKGFIKSGTTASGTVIGNLPVGYRPLATILLAGVGWNANNRIDVFPNGDIVARIVDAGWTSLENITFMAEQ